VSQVWVKLVMLPGPLFQSKYKRALIAESPGGILIALLSDGISI
jgi:hypothetical protein